MDEYEQKLKNLIQAHHLQATHLVYAQSCHSVAEAAQAADVAETDFVKNICLLDADGHLIVAIVKGEDRASLTRISKALGIPKPRLATPQEILQKTGFPCGGTPSFGYEARFLIDSKVMEKEVIYSGGGSENSLVKISTKELQRANGGSIVSIRK